MTNKKTHYLIIRIIGGILLGHGKGCPNAGWPMEKLPSRSNITVNVSYITKSNRTTSAIKVSTKISDEQDFFKKINNIIKTLLGLWSVFLCVKTCKNVHICLVMCIVYVLFITMYWCRSGTEIHAFQENGRGCLKHIL